MGFVSTLCTCRGTFCTHGRRRELDCGPFRRRFGRFRGQHVGAFGFGRQQQQLDTCQGGVTLSKQQGHFCV